MRRSRLRILVSGMLAGVPGQGGATWVVLQYVLGLRRLGHDVCFVEPAGDDGHGGREAVCGPGTFSSPGVAAWFREVTASFGLEGRAALLGARGRDTLGLPRSELVRFARGADVLLNLSGVLRDPELLSAVSRRVYVDLDPVFTQLWASQGIDMGLGGHDRFATVGLSLGGGECPVPTCGLPWIPTLQPVVLDLWPPAGRVRHEALTTVANWRGYGSVEHEGVFYGQKAHSLRRFVTLPERAPGSFLLALAIHPGDGPDLAALRRHGWRLVDPGRVASTPGRYRAFVRGSLAEFGLSKAGYVDSRSGWFSDRSVCYLASGRPVLAQETGFSRHLPVGRGLLAFETAEDVLEGLDALATDYATHAAAAREMAETHFASDRVLTRLLEAVGGCGGGGDPGAGRRDAP